MYIMFFCISDSFYGYFFFCLLMLWLFLMACFSFGLLLAFVGWEKST